MNAPGHVLVVGASASGLCTVEALRRRGFGGRITVIGDEPHAPYDRPPLSKQVLSGAWEPDRAALRSAVAVSALDADFVLGDQAVGLDPSSHTVRMASGREIGADVIVIATGVRARRFPGQETLAGAHVLRTLDDTLALRRDLLAASRLVVVGEGVLGSEIAATARTLGLDVTLAGPLAAPMFAQIGPFASGLLAQLHEERGVRLRLGTGVTGLIDNAGRVGGVRLASGEELPADVVVVAIGASPATDWLADSGLSIDNGLVCDSHCRAAEGIYAVGDVARWHHPQLGRLVRFENRTNATEQAEAVAAAILGDDTPYAPVPYFWTDQFDVKIQVFGVITADADMEIVEGDPAARRFVARYGKQGVVTGVLGWNMPKQVRAHRQDVVDALAAVEPGPVNAIGMGPAAPGRVWGKEERENLCR
jgi:NADPH-dependent 2,4-dienoyl-CoA reductase/sulfur reductase-like enzyme